MQDILGHDINGRPLRFGDEVAVVAEGADMRGATCSIVDRCDCGCDGALLDIRSEFSKTGYKSAYFRSLRKLTDDHRPADESFGEMMGTLVGNKHQQA